MRELRAQNRPGPSLLLLSELQRMLEMARGCFGSLSTYHSQSCGTYEDFLEPNYQESVVGRNDSVLDTRFPDLLNDSLLFRPMRTPLFLHHAAHGKRAPGSIQ